MNSESALVEKIVSFSEAKDINHMNSRLDRNCNIVCTLNTEKIIRFIKCLSIKIIIPNWLVKVKIYL